MGIKTQADYEAKKAEIDRKLNDVKTKAPEVKPAENKNTGNTSNTGTAPKAPERKDLTVGSEPQAAEAPSDDLPGASLRIWKSAKIRTLLCIRAWSKTP